MAQPHQHLIRVPSAYQLADLVLIEAVTHVHAGVGRAGGVVDLPVQRDEYGYPCIYASSLKGALKTALLWALVKEKNDLTLARRAAEALLGPEPEPEESFESSVAVLDARLVAMPVRSLRGVYAYVTSPVLLSSFLEYSRLHSAKGNLLKDVESLSKEAEGVDKGSESLLNDVESLLREAKEVDRGSCLCVGSKDQLVVSELNGESELHNKIILLEELWLDPKPTQNGSALSKALGLDKPLLVLHDDEARHAIDRGLLRLTRVRLRRDTKTVEEGGLWSEEYVPAKTRFATVFLFKKPPLPERFVASLLGKQSGQEQQQVNDAAYLEALVKLGLLDDSTRKRVEEALQKNDLAGAVALLASSARERVKKLLTDQLKGYIVLGGHETIGKGIVKLRVDAGIVPDEDLPARVS
ncbi:MAG: type III-B CRISPR module RAMP protein Cmr4 [Thermofilaceae archaeon]